MPPAATRTIFAEMIGALSRRLRTPVFEPHITLGGCADVSEQETVARVTRLANDLAPIPIQLAGVAYTDAYFRCLFFTADKTPELLAAYNAAATCMRSLPDADFLPHLSLVYGNVANAEKETIIEEFSGRLPITFVADSLALCLPVGSPEQWRLLGPFNLMRTV